MKNINAPEWKDAGRIKKIFRKRGPNNNRGKIVERIFPYYLFCYGNAGRSIHQLIIVVDWYLNLTAEENKETWEKVRKNLQRPRVCAIERTI